MRKAESKLTIIFAIVLVSIVLINPRTTAQIGGRVAFGINPAMFRAGQPASAELSVSSVSTALLMLSPGSSFAFFVDSSVGTVVSFTTPVSVSSAGLSAADFSVSFGISHNQIVLTYNGQTKPFAYGDCLSVKIDFIANAQAGTGKLSLSSQFVSSVNGTLPFTVVSIVDFANSGTAAITHDQSLIGDGTSLMPLGIAPGGVTNSDLAVGAVTGPKISQGQVVKSLNGARDDVSVFGASNITVAEIVTIESPAVQPVITGLLISAPNVLTSVTHDTTLAGSGAGGSPLGISVPLNLAGSAPGGGVALVTASNSAVGNHGIEGIGGPAGAGLVGTGGNLDSDIGAGGPGVFSFGGDNPGSGSGGPGILAVPGNFSNGKRQGLAGDFRGDVSVGGTLTKSSGSFKIDHPLDPANKYLYHSFVESPDMKNIYDGITELDARGEAAVELPDWFGALNRDFRYQLTCIGGFAPVYIAAKVANNRFRIAGGLPGMEVSWQVTGIRRDAWANAHRIPVEESKPDRERGFYLHPELFSEPEDKSTEWARNPQMMQRLKDRRELMKQRVRTDSQ
jgi:hypothetical protein